VLVTGRRWKTEAAGAAALIAALLVWLWPIGIGGKMLVGGDVTQFFMGLMQVLGESLRAGRLPVWNDLWGYGFPGLAESQMGVFYPVHVILYRWLGTETAYVVSLVVHTLWGGLGAYWAARRLSISCAGSVLAAFSWSTCGFFLIHLAHPWGYTTGCWMPWAWGLTWCALATAGTFRNAAPFLLNLVLVLQVLPGHFQLAFMTQFGILQIVAWAAVERGVSVVRRRALSISSGLSLRSAASVLLALVAVFPLAAIQLWPTARLAGLAGSQRDYEYLSGFASTPFHLVNYVAPGLFHRSPYWRPLVWDPFHTSPEEQLVYIGLVPLFLAGLAMVREYRRDRQVRLLAILFAVTLVLSLGPYFPGFSYLIMLPGFSFFRAPSRWSLATAFALALLAGKGFDRWRDWPGQARSLQRFSFAAVLWAAALVGLIEVALFCTSRPGLPLLARGFQRALDAMPWENDFAAVMAQARGPADDPRIPAGLSRGMFLQKNGNSGSFVSERGTIYLQELGEMAALVVAIAVVGRLSERGRIGLGNARWALVALTFIDLWVFGRHRLLDVGPLRPLAEQSPVLARLAQEPSGTRVVSERNKNLPMLVGLAPILAYRTLDLPAVPELTQLTRGPLSAPAIEQIVLDAMRATGTGLRVFDPVESGPARGALRATGTGLRVSDPVENRVDHVLKRVGGPRETIEDPALARWLFGSSWVNEQGPWARTFTVWHSEKRPVRAWLVTCSGSFSDVSVLEDWSGGYKHVLEILDRAEPLAAASPMPEEWNISVQAEDPGWVIVSQLADPQWIARWIGLDGQGTIDGDILPVFQKESQPGGWQRVEVPASGRWTLRLEYDARDVAEGAAISTVAWLCWIVAASSTVFHAWRGRSAPGPVQTEA
jgi:hypothetical protein